MNDLNSALRAIYETQAGAVSDSAGRRPQPAPLRGARLTVYECFFGSMLLGIVGVLLYFELTDRGLTPQQRLADEVRELGGRIHFEPAADGKPLRAAIDFSGVPICDDDLRCLRFVASLERLDLSRTGVTDESLQRLAELENVGELDLAFTQVTDSGLKYVARLGAVRKLVLTGTRTTDETLGTLAMLPALEELDLRATRVSDTGLQALSACKRLKVLRVDDARVVPALARHVDRSSGRP